MKPSSSNENQFQLGVQFGTKKTRLEKGWRVLKLVVGALQMGRGKLKKKHIETDRNGGNFRLFFVCFFLFVFFSACRARRTFLGRSFIVVRFHYTFPYDGCHANAVAMATAAQWHRFIFFLSLFFSLVRAFKGLAAGADYSSMGCDLKKKTSSTARLFTNWDAFRYSGFFNLRALT